MDNINYKTDESYPFDEISLITPRPMQGGSFFSKVVVQNGKPMLFQTPRCLTKNGIIRTDKKIYCDLKFSEIHETFIQWFQYYVFHGVSSADFRQLLRFFRDPAKT